MEKLSNLKNVKNMSTIKKPHKRTILENGGSKMNVGYVLFYKHKTFRRPTNALFTVDLF